MKKKKLTFPLVYIPNDIKVTKDHALLYPEKPKKPKVPKKPEPELKSERGEWLDTPIGCLGLLILLGFVCLFIGRWREGIGYIAIGISLYSLIFIYAIISNRKDDKRNKKMLKAYEQQLNLYKKYEIEYNKNLENYNKKVALLEDSEFRKELADRKLRQALFKCPKPVHIQEQYKQGVSENKFHQKLKDIFGNKILKNHSIADVPVNYMPDFVYYDKESGLCIDIEIDEPYEGHSNQPIHCIGEDTIRNEYFLSKNWLVIRFAEEQVITNPLGCINWIIYFINYCLDSEIKGYKAEKLEKVNCWTKEEAELMAFKLYRNNYIPILEIEDIFRKKVIKNDNSKEEEDDLPF
ncbi:MAG: hypothetical protein DWQ06_14740 [Calditrichaeota bacterium]|nr:MAG: hypothetical protein DWQ06_14740 [Calditrichota bacterium]